MKIIDVVARSGRNLKNAKVRTLLTSLAIAVGAFTLVLTLAAGNGIREYTDELVQNNFDPAELLVGRDREVTNTGTPNETPQEYESSVGSLNAGGDPNSSIQIKQVTQDDVDELKSLDYVESVSENFQLNISYITRDGQKKYTAGGSAYSQGQKPNVIYGELPEGSDIEKGTILLPDVYLDILGFNDPEMAIGSEIIVGVEESISVDNIISQLNSGQSLQQNLANFSEPVQKTFKYKIGAITKKPTTSLAFGVPTIVFNNQDARELYDISSINTSNYEQYVYVSVRVVDGQDKQKLEDARNDLVAKGYFVLSSEDIQKTIAQFVNVLQIMVAVFGLITVIASIFGIVNTQYISVLERTREIGLMKALGMSKRAISNLFMIEATWIGFIGGAIGSIGGLIIGILLNPWISNKLDLDDNSLLIFKLWQIILLILALMLVATIAGLLPARKAAKLDPITALRTE